MKHPCTRILSGAGAEQRPGASSLRCFPPQPPPSVPTAISTRRPRVRARVPERRARARGGAGPGPRQRGTGAPPPLCPTRGPCGRVGGLARPQPWPTGPEVAPRSLAARGPRPLRVLCPSGPRPSHGCRRRLPPAGSCVAPSACPLHFKVPRPPRRLPFSLHDLAALK